ncbi:hypothetical protein BSKO_10403 [Bryopsis sp. KO-2023]|nr:hypothetical protein BSKO_10403 [Bryopsis sp. KO-2023]
MRPLAGRLSLDRLSWKTLTWWCYRFQHEKWNRGFHGCMLDLAGIDFETKNWRRSAVASQLGQEPSSCRHVHSLPKLSGDRKKLPRNTDPVVSAFKSLIQDTDPKMWFSDVWDDSVIDRWNNCKEFALASMDTALSFRVANLICCCKQCRRIDVCLLDEVMAAAMNNEKIMLDFAPIGIGICIQSVGMLARLARANKDARAKFFDGRGKDFVLALLVECKQRGLWTHEDCSPRILASVMHGLGLLFGKSPLNSGGRRAEVLEAAGCIAEEFCRQKNTFRVTSHDVANILYGCEVLGFDDKRLTSKACRILVRRLDFGDKINPQILSNVLWALGKTGFDDKSVLSRLGREVNKKSELAGFSEQSLANIVYAYGLLEFDDFHSMDGLLNEIIEPHRLREFNQQELSNIVYGLGKVGYSNDSLMGQLCAEIIKEHRLAIFSQQGMANIMYGLGKAKFFDRNVWVKLMNEASQRVGKFSCQELANMMYGLALVEPELSNGDMSALVELMDKTCAELKRRRMEDFDSQSLAVAVWCLGVLRYYDEVLMEVLLEGYMRIEENIKAIELSMIMISCASHGHRNNRLFKMAQNYVFGSLSDVSDLRLVCNFMWAFAILGILSNIDFERFCLKVASLEAKEQDMVVAQWRQVVQAWLYIQKLKPDPPRYGLSHEVDRLLSKAKQNWRNEEISDHTTTFESKIRAILLAENVAFAPKSKTVDGLLEVDFLVKQKDTTKDPVVVECDGVWHYTINQPFRTMSHTVFRNKVLKAAGFKVVCVPFFLKQTERVAVIKELVQSMTPS